LADLVYKMKRMVWLTAPNNGRLAIHPAGFPKNTLLEVSG